MPGTFLSLLLTLLPTYSPRKQPFKYIISSTGKICKEKVPSTVEEVKKNFNNQL